LIFQYSDLFASVSISSNLSSALQVLAMPAFHLQVSVFLPANTEHLNFHISLLTLSVLPLATKCEWAQNSLLK